MPGKIVEGEVNFSFDLSSAGKVESLSYDSGPPADVAITYYRRAIGWR
jgi:hypothetical protein